MVPSYRRRFFRYFQSNCKCVQPLSGDDSQIVQIAHVIKLAVTGCKFSRISRDLNWLQSVLAMFLGKETDMEDRDRI